MQLSPLQSRLAASLIASCLLLVIYFLLLSPQFAVASELDYTANYPDLADGTYDDPAVDETSETLGLRSPLYEPDFGLFDRSIIGRAPAGVIGLVNNVKLGGNLEPGQSLKYVFEASSLDSRQQDPMGRPVELRRSPDESQDGGIASQDGPSSMQPENVRRQQASRTLYISANTCDQVPRINASQTTVDPPQLSLYVSTSSDNTEPGPGKGDVGQAFVLFDEGLAVFNTTLTDAVFFTVSAPQQVSDEYFSQDGIYTFEIAASIDQPYHSLDTRNNSQLVWVDSDASATLFTSFNLTNTSDEVVTTPPYVMFAHNMADVALNGIRKSYCGLSKHAQFRGLDNGQSSISMSLKKGGENNLTRQEFFVNGLNASSQYMAILVQDPEANTAEKRDNVPGGGGLVFRQTNFTTKQGESTRTNHVSMNCSHFEQRADRV
jgi:calcium channel MID1